MESSKVVFCIILFSFSLLSNSKDVSDDSLKVHPQVITGYSIDAFLVPTERIFNIYTIGVGYKGEKSSLYGLFNEGVLRLPKSSNQQYELDFYNNPTKLISYWVNYAYSNDLRFPNHRIIGRMWYQLDNNFLVSGGLKYYYFKENIFISSLGIEKYVGNYWIEGLIDFLFKDPGLKFSFHINMKYFWKDYNYIELSLMTGAAPDEPWRTVIPLNLKSHSIRSSICSYINKQKTMQIRAGVGYAIEEYGEDMWRNRLVGNVGLCYTFK